MPQCKRCKEAVPTVTNSWILMTSGGWYCSDDCMNNKQKRNTGKDSEKLFKKWFKKEYDFEPIRLQDMSGTHGSWALRNPCDFIGITKTFTGLYEIKSTQEDTFAISCITQLEKLKYYGTINPYVKSFVWVHFIALNCAFCVDVCKITREGIKTLKPQNMNAEERCII